MPKALEKDRYIINTTTVASTSGKMKRLFATTKQIRVRVSYALDRPFYEKKRLKIINGVVAEIIFQFENLIGLCKHCNLIQHESNICVKVGEQSLTLFHQSWLCCDPFRQPNLVLLMQISNSKGQKISRPSHSW